MPPRPQATSEASPPDYAAVRFEALEHTVAELSDRLEKVAGVIESLAKIELPSPEALNAIEVRVAALEDDDVEHIDYGDRDDDLSADSPRRPVPEQRLCDECGAVEGVHFDHCSSYKPRRAA